MCLSTPNVDTDTPAPSPAPAEESAESPALNETTKSTKNEDNTLAAKKRGRSSLRIDLNTGSKATGLNIPGA